ncbi:MAG: 50S ribosome-binding GTPase, partial [Planctomycetota bacterium]|nr:50S ribosome-binding GTPase [Planctomycetota bacterium]
MDASETQADSAAALPRVVIVGRPNVGKSTLLNRMCGSRIAIVEPTAGVTRDRIAVPARLNTPAGDRWFEVVDTGGIGIVDRDDLGPHVEGQVRLALDKAHLVLFMVDVRSGIMHLDKAVAKTMRALDVPTLLVVNKTEGEKLHWDVDVFRRLGIHGEPVPISAQNGEGLTDLYAQIHAACP